MSLTLVTVTGTFNKAPGVPSTGTLQWQLSADLFQAGVPVANRDPIPFQLNATGAFSVQIWANDDVGTAPTGTYWVLSGLVDGVVFSEQYVISRTMAPTVDISALTPAAAVSPSYPVVSYVVNTDGTLSVVTSGNTVTISRAPITGDVSVPAGSDVATLAGSGVAAGTYTAATVTVDAKGRVTSASSGAYVPVINVASHATAGAGTAASHYTGWESALASAASGSVFYFAGVFETSQDVFTFDGTSNVTLFGLNSNVNPTPTGFATAVFASQIIYNGKATTAAFSAKETVGFKIDGLAITCKSTATLTGALVDASGTDSAHISGSVTVRDSVLDCSSNSTTATSCLKATNVVFLDSNNVMYGGANYGIHGADAGTDYSNVMNVRGGYFINQLVAPLHNPVSQWTMVGVTFESASTAAKNNWITCSINGATVDALTFINCKQWDFSTGAVPTFKLDAATVYGLVVTGCHIPASGANNPAFQVGAVSGGSITGNVFDSAGVSGAHVWSTAVGPSITDMTITGNSMGASGSTITDNTSTYVDGTHITKSLVVDTTGTQLLPTVTTPTTAIPGHPPIAGYIGWWDASQVLGVADGAALSSWSDLSSGAHTMSQATGAAQPTFYSSTAAKTVNGLPAVWFDGTDDVMTTAAVLDAATAPWTVFTVSLEAAANANFPFANGSASNWTSVVTDGGAGGWGLLFGGVSWYQFQAAEPTLNKAHTAAVSFPANAGTLTALIDGTVHTAAAGTPGTPATSSALGEVNSTFHNGAICEVLVYNQALSVGQMTEVCNYLKAKWGTP